MFLFYVFASALVAMIAYLQADAKWWKGPAVAIVLCVVSISWLIGNPAFDVDQPATMPVSGFVSALLIGAILVGLGSTVALILRRRKLTAKRISMFAFCIALIFSALFSPFS